MKITFEWMRKGSSRAERNDPRRQTLAFSQDDLDVNVLFVAAFHAVVSVKARTARCDVAAAPDDVGFLESITLSD